MSEDLVEAIAGSVLASRAGKQWLPAVQTAQGYLSRAGTGDETGSLVDAVLERLAQVDGWSDGAFGAKVRIAMQGAAYRALRGQSRAAFLRARQQRRPAAGAGQSAVLVSA